MRRFSIGFAILGIAAVITFTISPNTFATGETKPLKQSSDVPPPQIAIATPGEHDPEELDRILRLTRDDAGMPSASANGLVDADSQTMQHDYEAMRAIQSAHDPIAALEFKIDETLNGQMALNEQLAEAGRTQAPLPPVPMRTATSSVEGVVMAGDSGLPVSNVFVGIYDAGRNLIDGAVTDRFGAYRLFSYYSRTVYARVNPAGVYPYYFMPEWHDNKPTLSSATPISVSTENIATVDFTLDRGAQISGTATAADTGAPLEGVRVYVIDSEGYAVDYTATDAAGQYTTGGLQSGGYRLYFQTTLASGAAREYVGEYFNNTYKLSLADLVTVTAPSILPGVNVSLTRGAQITGLVSTEDTSVPLQSVEVKLLGGSTPTVLAQGTTDAAGRYAFIGLADGDYRVYFGPGVTGGERYYGEYYNDKASFTAADIISVTTPNVSGNINAQLGRAGQITGRVVAEDTSQPISRTFVYATSLYDPVSMPGYYGATTNASGQYSITAPAGSYKVGFFSAFDFSQRYCEQYYNNKSSPASADVVEVQSSRATSNINAALSRTGQITGLVTAADTGAPLRDVLVSTGDDFINPLYATRTNASGHYALQLCTGSHVIEFLPSFTDSTKYAREYYDDKATLASANPVSVIAPNTRANINAALERVGAISGVVTAADTGAPLPGVYAAVFDRDGGFAHYAQTDGQGNYTIPFLRSGSYKLRFSPPRGGFGIASDYLFEYHNDKASFSEADLIVVTGAQTTQVNASLSRGGKITGTVTSSSGVSLVAPYAISLLSTSGKLLDNTYTDSAGRYQFVVGTGSYVVLVRPFGSDDAFEYYNDKSSLSAADAVSITAPNTIGNVNFALDKGGQITGQLVDALDDSGVAYAIVEIFESTNNASPILDIRTGSSSYYTSTFGLPTGSYKLRVSASAYLTQFFDRKLSFDEAELVTVTAPNTTGNVIVSLVPFRALPPRQYLPFISR